MMSTGGSDDGLPWYRLRVRQSWSGPSVIAPVRKQTAHSGRSLEDRCHVVDFALSESARILVLFW